VSNQVKVGVGVIIKKDSRYLLGKRKGSHGEGTWSFPGGHLEFGESTEKTAIREVQEEVGIKIKNLEKVTYTNDYFHETNKHYITLFIKADYDSGEVKIMEPDKCTEWKWFKWEEMPRPLFLPIENLMKELQDKAV
jgi:8-oxo-dGTP diphosphatase